MAIYEIPLQAINGHADSLSVTLEGAAYIFRFDWKERLEAWYMDLERSDGTAIFRGQRCTPEFNYGDLSLDLPGTLVIFGQEDAPRDGIGTRWQLYYVTSDHEL